MRQLIVITDATPFGDDSIAIAMLTAAQDANVRLIVATSGNVWAEEAAQNTCALLSRLGREDIGVCVGMSSAAFKQRPAYAQNLATRPAPRYAGALDPEAPGASSEAPACADLFEAIAAADRPDLLVLGPASVVASLLSVQPDIVDQVGRVFLMGGSMSGGGNATAAAEFNFWFDPEAAETLLASSLSIILLPLDVTRGLSYSPDFPERLDSASPEAEHVRECLSRRPLRPVCDEVLAAVVLDPTIAIQQRKIKISVDTSIGQGYGSVHVLSEAANRRPVEVIERINPDAFWGVMFKLLGRRN
jgi:inosine-uridine nucleoside N-ribohydrolase